jgi:Ca2+:H+ antiporter
MNSRLWWPLGLLLIVPVSPVLEYVVGLEGIWIFLTGAIAIGVLADWMRRATENLAAHVGSAIGGLLNVSFGSLAEIILAFFVLARGEIDVVRAQITGSIIGTSLFGLGLAIVVGSIGRSKQTVNRDKAGQLANLLILVVIALLLPAVFDYTGRHLSRWRRTWCPALFRPPRRRLVCHRSSSASSCWL